MINSSFLSDRSKEIILGSLLGDGSLKIHSGYKNARFSFRHSVGQKDYFFWKVKELKEISGDSYFWKQKADGFGGEKLRYQSLALSQLTELYHLTHQKDRFVAQPEWLKLLRLILPYIKVEAMLSKILLLYRNPELQQRWISEVSSLTGFSEKIIQKYVNTKKAKWKIFRE